MNARTIMGGHDPRLRAALCTEMLDMPLRGISGTLRVSEVVFVDLDEGERARRRRHRHDAYSGGFSRCDA